MWYEIEAKKTAVNKIQGGNANVKAFSWKQRVSHGDNVKIIFLGGSGNHHRIMIDAPKDVNIVRSKALKKHMKENGIECEFPSYYEEKEHPEKYRRK